MAEATAAGACRAYSARDSSANSPYPMTPGPNAAMAFTNMKPWDRRDGATTADEARRAQEALAGTEGMVMSLMPPAIEELGNSYGFTMRLVDQGHQGAAALQAAQARLLELAAQSSAVTGVYPEGLPPGTGVRLETMNFTPARPSSTVGKITAGSGALPACAARIARAASV